LGGMMRRVRGAGNVVAEEWLARIDLINAVKPINGVIGHAGDQVPTRLTVERIDLRGIAEQVRRPLVRVTANKPVEILKAHAEWPLVKRSDRARLEGRCVVVFAEPRGGVTII